MYAASSGILKYFLLVFGIHMNPRPSLAAFFPQSIDDKVLLGFCIKPHNSQLLANRHDNSFSKPRIRSSRVPTKNKRE
jgi:hypothetical protein